MSSPWLRPAPSPELSIDMSDFANIYGDWAPPEGLTNGEVEALASKPTVWLDDVIKIMAGLPKNADEDAAWIKTLEARARARREGEITEEMRSAEDAENFERTRNTGKRRRAASALFFAVSQSKESVVFGSRAGVPDGPIGRLVFDFRQNLNNETNSFSLELVGTGDKAEDDDQFFRRHFENKSKWRDVRVDGAWLAGWLKSQLDIARTEAVAPESRFDLDAVLKAIIAEHGDHISQNRVFELCQDMPGHPDRKIIRKAWVTLTGHRNSGPRGPKKNRAEPAA